MKKNNPLNSIDLVGGTNEPSSFRDVSGFVYYKNGNINRRIESVYLETYDRLVGSGLYKHLVGRKLLIEHEEIERTETYATIRPQKLKFISYPYEWCFGQLKEAALLTLEILKVSLDFGMMLKDASAYNVQFNKGKAVFIDTLSFDSYKEGRPWLAYRQFCEHFLAPLVLMAYKDQRLGKLLQTHIDGIPLDLAVKLLPTRARLSPTLQVHIYLHAMAMQKAIHVASSNTGFGLTAFRGLIDNLESYIKGLSLAKHSSFWKHYYEDMHNYEREGIEAKKTVVSDMIDKVHPNAVWDLGCNTGLFSELAARKSVFVLASDLESVVIESVYQNLKGEGVENILPLVLDMAQPSPGIGWGNVERKSFLSRAKFDLTMMLAVTHHLRITGGIPYIKQAELMKDVTTWLLIEFVPESDTHMRSLLSNREETFIDLHEEKFMQAYLTYFDLADQVQIKTSMRKVFLFKNKLTNS